MALALWGLCLVPVAWCDGVITGQDEVSLLRRQVQYLSDALARARAESDVLKARLDRKRFDEDGGAGAGAAADLIEGFGKDYKILEINEELGIVVLKAGRRQGIRTGLQFAAMRGDQAIATLRVIDVRATIAGAVLEKTHGGYPRAQDRVVLVTGTRE